MKVVWNHLRLQAINPLKNVNRVYEIQIEQGLLNTITVLIAYGRSGGGTQQRLYYFENLFQANVFVKRIIQKRFNAHKRIGCGYEVV